MTVRDIDRGADKILRQMRKKGEVRVGVMDSEARATKTDAKLTVGEVAVIHEFGLGVPQRSFIRDAVDEREQKIRAALRAISKRVAKGASLKTELDRLGLQIQGRIQGRMSDGIPPPLSEITKQLRKHGGTTPLIDTGQLRSSVTFVTEVDDG